MAKAEEEQLTLTDNTLEVLSANPGVTFTPEQLRLVAAGRIVVKHGCIKRLVYSGNHRNLVSVLLDPSGWVAAPNLDDFRRVFEHAANHGHGVIFCYNIQTKEISMPALIVCQCPCRKHD